MTKRALVTGGAGFLGSHLTERLLADGYRVICVDNLGSGRRENIKQFLQNDDFQLKEVDIRKDPGLPPTDEVYHFASRASPKDFTEYPVQIALTNTEGTRHLLDYARDYDAKMIYASTSEVYGDPEVHPQEESYNGSVNIRGPRGCYDESKRFGETLTAAYKRKYNVDVRTIRIFNTYGPRMRPDDGRVVPTFVTQALRGDDLTIYGDGTQTRSFCYVDDLVDGIRAVMQVDEPTYDVYNLGNQNERTIRDLAKEILEATNTESDITYEPLPEDDPGQRKPDISRIQEDLGWEPTVPLSAGLQETVAHFERILRE
ncbi:nucleoside-diphosphate-sugar epimerase [Halovivax ruber XH-70]|uniref:Nucleoside-diphosphate-sugar epimerase n=1 Tax=Halovivax ruber (strain DSM 18193 / JCM 13892 / XH-70) TaxID=797302 RepID=L0ICD8_HALRX|nr:UDP-glucuronic acid decarboxylase family protein [Halovivax ruber]AGB15632.1 nucleoside-diphosphate-sugar epimerase [Halovivax ruber XH-70]